MFWLIVARLEPFLSGDTSLHLSQGDGQAGALAGLALLSRRGLELGARDGLVTRHAQALAPRARLRDGAANPVLLRHMTYAGWGGSGSGDGGASGWSSSSGSGSGSG